VFGAIPETVGVTHAGHAVTGHPALVDEGDSVGLRVLPTADEARAAMWGGTRRLLLLQLASPLRTLDRSLPNAVKLVLASSPRASAADVYRDCAAAAVDQLLVEHGGPVRDEAAFGVLLSAVRAGFAAAAVRLARLAADGLSHASVVDATLATMLTPAHDETVLDARAHLDRLLRRGWIADAGFDQLPDVVRYLRALEHRVQKARTEPERDRRQIAGIQRLEREHREVAGRDAAGQLRSMLEELRVATFAQSIGAKGGVSEQKVRAALARLA
jgi:ATP-dependent helicase HrpA